MVITLSPCTAICGSTSALGKTLPGCAASDDAHAATGDGPDTRTGVMAATAVDEVISASAIASAEIDTAFLGNFTNPLCVPCPEPEFHDLNPSPAVDATRLARPHPGRPGRREPWECQAAGAGAHGRGNSR